MNRPQPDEYPAYAKIYVNRIGDDVLNILAEQSITVPELFRANADRADYAYAADKWTLKEVLGHLIDSERVFAYRATCLARGEIQALPGFNENHYVANGKFNQQSLEDLVNEFTALRKANCYLFQSFNEEALNNAGTASGMPITVKAILFVTAGHVAHHIHILKERYHVV